MLFGWAENPAAANRDYKHPILRAHELDPGYGAILIEVGDLRAEAGDLAGVRAAYEDAARQSADTVLTKLFLAMSLARVGRDAESEEGVVCCCDIIRSSIR